MTLMSAEVYTAKGLPGTHHKATASPAPRQVQWREIVSSKEHLHGCGLCAIK